MNNFKSFFVSLNLKKIYIYLSMNSPDTYLLFYSNYCANCKEFIQQLYKSPFFDKFKRITIDNNQNIPKEITAVPCIIVPKIAKPLTGTEAFRWLRGMNQIFLQEKEKAVSNQANDKAQNSEPPKVEGQTGDPTNINYAMGSVSAYSGTMGGFSDNFSFIGNENPMEHSFVFLGKGNDQINTPQENGEDGREKSDSGSKKADIDKEYERMMAMRSNDMPKPIMRQ